jgi:hypothetical protein
MGAMRRLRERHGDYFKETTVKKYTAQYIAAASILGPSGDRRL